MPEANDFDHMPRIVEPVNYAIRTNYDFPNEPIFKLWNDSAKLRRSRKEFGVSNKKQTESEGSVRCIEGDVTDNVTKISSR